MNRYGNQIAYSMTNRVSGLFILFFTVFLVMGGVLIPHLGTPGRSIFGTITIVAEELRCPAYNLMKVSYPASELTDWKTFRSEAYGFEFRYPPAGQVQAYSEAKRKKVRVDLPVPKGTLLQEKFLLVMIERVSEENPDVIPGEESGKLVFINSREFSKKEFEEGAAGHLYEHTIYSTVKRDSRFVLDFVLHSVNPGVFDSPPADLGRKEMYGFIQTVCSFRFVD